MRENTDTLGLYNEQYQGQLAAASQASSNVAYSCNTYSNQPYVAQQNVLANTSATGPTTSNCSSTSTSNGFTAPATSSSDSYYSHQQKMTFNPQMTHSTSVHNSTRTTADPALAQYLISNQTSQNSYSNEYYSAPYSYNNLQIDSWPRYMNSERNFTFI